MYVLHYAPDNASLAVRLALEELGVPYRARSSTGRSGRRKARPTRSVSPTGLIPALETPHGAIFETGAILLWLADRHGGSPPRPTPRIAATSSSGSSSSRTRFMPTCAGSSIPSDMPGADKEGHRALTEGRILRSLALLDDALSAAPAWCRPGAPGVLGCYLAPLVRWLALYPRSNPMAPDLSGLPGAPRHARRSGDPPSAAARPRPKGSAPRPFTAPSLPCPARGQRHLRMSAVFLSVFEMFKVGIGPSSSHTMGPMVAAARFLDALRASPFTARGLRASLHGSLAFTGVGHATDRAVILGLAGFRPDTTTRRRPRPRSPASGRRSRAPGLAPLAFDPDRDLIFDYGPPLPGHANGMILMATDAQGDVILQETYYSVGGGFVLTAEELAEGKDKGGGAPRSPTPSARGRDAGDVRA
jgi:glutathione S-transferase